ncbi:MAG: XdhC family protein [Gammaproteobacteria bacterium]|nr:XdhC family protein [Gammaproteobacteria bacterium]
MDSVDLDVLTRALHWLKSGKSACLVTVVKTYGSSPRPPGALLAIRGDGRFCGSVSGGCVDEDLIEHYRGTLPTHPEVVRYGGSDAERLQLPCGGVVELVVEPLLQMDWLSDVVDNIQQRKITCRQLNLSSGESRLVAGDHNSVLSCGGEMFINVFGPQWRVFIIGAGQTSKYLAEMASALGYDVSVCDPREEYRREWELTTVDFVESMPDDAVQDMQVDNRTALITLTHDPKLDDLALLEGLNSDAFYIGALGSRANNKSRRERLAQHFNVSVEQLQRLHGPVGLPIGSRTPPEIALSIMAEITAIRHGKSLMENTKPESLQPAHLRLVDKAIA